MEAPIFKGSALAATTPCLAFGLIVMLSIVIHLLALTPENELAKRHLRYATCFNAGFSGSPNGRLRSRHVRRIRYCA